MFGIVNLRYMPCNYPKPVFVSRSFWTGLQYVTDLVRPSSDTVSDLLHDARLARAVQDVEWKVAVQNSPTVLMAGNLQTGHRSVKLDLIHALL
jgi:hypothetical protein